MPVASFSSLNLVWRTLPIYLGLSVLTLAQPVITLQPVSQEVPLGSAVTFRVVATNAGPLRYQWRLNGEILPGEKNAELTILRAQPKDGGSYSVSVSDGRTAINSDLARLTFTDRALPFSDEFDPLPKNNLIIAPSGSGRGNNRLATREKEEPRHGGKPGRKSVWLSWLAQTNGIASFTTTGSTFDTLLAVYVGNSLTNLVPIAANDDRGGFHTSAISFNAKAGTLYQIVVDGLAAAQGEILLTWKLEETAEVLPTIQTQPDTAVGLIGDDVLLLVTVEQPAVDTRIQWLLNGQEIPNATQEALPVGDLRGAKVGTYFARIQAGSREVLTEPVEIQIHIRGDGTVARDVKARDKFGEVADLISSVNPRTESVNRAARTLSTAPARGFSGTQIFSTFGATKEEGEPNHCGEIGGASEWYAYQAPTDGLLDINTDGSDFDTVLAVYTGPGTDFESLVGEACDNNSGLDGQDSRVTFPVRGGTIYYIVVDGVDAATGIVTLNYRLQAPPTISKISDQTGNEDAAMTGIGFTIGDADSGTTNLIVTGLSSNLGLVPNANIIIGGTGANRTLTIIPAANQFGTAAITLSVSDGSAAASFTFNCTFLPVNDLPEISSVAPISVPGDTPTPPLPFTVSDLDTPLSLLALSATVVASPSNLVENVIFGGTDENRTVTVFPAAHVNGTALITIVVTDDGGGQGRTSFPLTVNAVQPPPTIAAIPDQTALVNTTVGQIPVTVASSTVPPESLILKGTSSNKTLVPDENLLFGGSGANRALLILPAVDQIGLTTITISVSDGQLTASQSFQLTVSPLIQLKAQLISSNNLPRLRLTGFTAKGAIIQSSADLETWLPIYTNNASNGLPEPLDFNATGDSHRFFRARSAP